jgi:subtilisin family serine protease
MFPRTRSVAAAALLTAVALCLSGHVRADQDEASAPQDARRAGRRTSNLYIVQMAEQPVISYTGGIAGQPATKANRGQKIDPLSGAVIGYAGYLDQRHDQAIAASGGARKVYDYHYSFNGFAAELSDAQAALLRTTPGVLMVSKDVEQFADTSSTPSFLGLDAPAGLWDQLGGTARAGDEIIVGVIDSGIWPESESFSDRTGLNGNGTKGGKLSYHQIPGWHGKCTPGEQFPASMCNQKLIGAQRFNAAWGGDAGVKAQLPWEFASPRDYNGHGTHTSSTAAGNNGVRTDGPAATFGTVSGMAPHARIAMYKAL